MGRWRHGLLKAPEPGGLVSGLSLLQQRPLWPVPRQPGPPAWGGRVHLAETHGALPTPAGAHREAPALWALVCPGDRSSYCPGQGTQTLQLSQHHRRRQWCLQAKVGTLTGEQWGVLGWFPEHGVPEPGMWVTVENWASGAAATLPSPRTLFLRGPTFGKHPPPRSSARSWGSLRVESARVQPAGQDGERGKTPVTDPASTGTPELPAFPTWGGISS